MHPACGGCVGQRRPGPCASRCRTVRALIPFLPPPPSRGQSGASGVVQGPVPRPRAMGGGASARAPPSTRKSWGGGGQGIVAPTPSRVHRHCPSAPTPPPAPRGSVCGRGRAAAPPPPCAPGGLREGPGRSPPPPPCAASGRHSPGRQCASGLGSFRERNAVAPAAVRQAVGGGCQKSGWGRLLSVTNAVEAAAPLLNVLWSAAAAPHPPPAQPRAAVRKGVWGATAARVPRVSGARAVAAVAWRCWAARTRRIQWAPRAIPRSGQCALPLPPALSLCGNEMFLFCVPTQGGRALSGAGTSQPTAVGA